MALCLSSEGVSGAFSYDGRQGLHAQCLSSCLKAQKQSSEEASMKLASLFRCGGFIGVSFIPLEQCG